MTKAIRFHNTGPSRVLKYEQVSIAQLKPNEVLVEHKAIGVNFIDIYVRTGLYPNSGLPSGIGFEGAGVILDVGPKVKRFSVGDRVAYCHGDLGAYAQQRIIHEQWLIKLPPSISNKTAAAVMLKGMTAQYLIKQTCKIKAGDHVLFHAASGGVGLIACQWMRAIGANVIGTVGSQHKVSMAKKNGCKWVINLEKENFVSQVKEITNGKGVRVVYDGIGKSTFMNSLDCLRPRGLMVSFGNASGPPPKISPLVLAAKGSLFLTRPTLAHFVSPRNIFEKNASELFKIISDKKVKIRINSAYPLKDAKKAHRDLESRQTLGSSILIP